MDQGWGGTYVTREKAAACSLKPILPSWPPAWNRTIKAQEGKRGKEQGAIRRPLSQNDNTSTNAKNVLSVNNLWLQSFCSRSYMPLKMHRWHISNDQQSFPLVHLSPQQGKGVGFILLSFLEFFSLHFYFLFCNFAKHLHCCKIKDTNEATWGRSHFYSFLNKFWYFHLLCFSKI